MQVLLNSDTQIKDHRAMTSYLETVLVESLGRFGGRVLRVDAHLSDDNSAAKTDVDDIHCTLEAQVTGLAPVIAKDKAATSHQAIQGAVGKLERAIAHAIGKHEPGRAKASREESSST
jgi:hypothetical protein